MPPKALIGAILRHAVAIAAYVATLFIVVARVLNLGDHPKPWLDPNLIGFTIGVMFFLGPLALGILALDYIVFRTRTWSWIVIALGAMVPWACYRGGIIRPSSSWLMVTPILFGLLVHRGLFLLLSPESWSSRETNR